MVDKRPGFVLDAASYVPTKNKVLGRTIAGGQFLEAIAQHSIHQKWLGFYQKNPQVTEYDLSTQLREVSKIDVDLVDEAILDSYGHLGSIMFYPGPDFSGIASRRATIGNKASYSICGITHTTASMRAMQGICDLVSGPAEPYDALICTSKAVGGHVKFLLEAEIDRLRRKFGKVTVHLPELPIIPLGIHSRDFAITPDRKVTARAKLGLSPNTVCILYVGRLSFHAKAHPISMYQAIERVSKRTKLPITLLECGWFADESVEKAYRAFAKDFCPSVHRIVVNGSDREVVQECYAAADIFCSLVDNIQETFGITPLEAMCAGLPSVVSDWDGYKESVIDGETGFRIPTLIPPESICFDIIDRYSLGYDDYDHYVGHASSYVAVDIEYAATKLLDLVNNPELRAKMGACAKSHATNSYDWRIIVKQYEKLWAELDEKRKALITSFGLPKRLPKTADPFASFKHYATSTVDIRYSVLRTKETAQVKEILKKPMISYASPVLPSENIIGIVSDNIPADAYIPISQLLMALNEYPSLVNLTDDGLIRTLVFLKKIGGISLRAPDD